MDAGLFDPVFQPACYEDTDAAVILSKIGYATMLQPLAVVSHLVGGSYDKLGTKDNLMATNEKVFIAKHGAYLSSHCHHSGGHSLHTFMRQPNRLLVLDEIVPSPDKDAGSIRAREMLRILTDSGYSVTLETTPVRILNFTKYIMLPLLLTDGVNVVVPGTLKAMTSVAKCLQKLSLLMVWPFMAVIVSRSDVYALHMKHIT